MARSTGVVLAIGGITWVNQTVVHHQPNDIRLPVSTAIAAGVFALAERAWPAGAVAVAYVALLTVLFTRITPGVPAPAESLTAFMRKGG